MLLLSRESRFVRGVLGVAIGVLSRLRQVINDDLIVLLYRLGVQMVELNFAPSLLLRPVRSLCLQILQRGCDGTEYFHCLTLLRPNCLHLLHCVQRLL